MRHPSLTLLSGAAALALALTIAPPSATAVPEPAPAAAASGVAWLATQQQADGGFEVAGFPGFETADVALALASEAQTGATWSTAEALAGVQAVQTGGGKDALDALDDLAEGAISAGQAAKLVALVASPLGLDPADFDPSADSAGAVDLTGVVDAAAGPGNTWPDLAFSARLYVAMSLPTDNPLPALIDAIEAAQQPNGSWNFEGTAVGTGVDVDTTGLALQALAAHGLGADRPSVRAGLRVLARAQAGDGSWTPSFAPTADPNSTAVATLGVAAAGGDPAVACWREAVEPAWDGVPYTSPIAWIVGHQLPDGRVPSPNDGFGVNTFATSQAVQGLVHNLPVIPAVSLACGTTGASARFVHAAYHDVLGRLADQAGTDHQVGRLAAGASRAAVVATLAGSGEARDRTVDTWFRTHLGRPADAGARATFGALIRQGRRATAQASVLGSAEFLAKAGGTDTTFATALYQQVLGRGIDAGAKASVLARLDAGWTRARVAQSVLTSAEARGVAVRDLYRTYLRRPVDSSAKAYWVGRLATGTTHEAMTASLVGSAEYLDLTS